jgi:hypothetical protein
MERIATINEDEELWLAVETSMLRTITQLKLNKPFAMP